MTTSLTRAIMGAAAAGALTLAFAASGWSMHRDTDTFEDPAAVAQKMTYRMNYTMDFSQEQQQAVTDILSSALTESTEARERMQELRRQLHTLHTSFDAQAAEQLTAEIGDLTAALALTRLSAQAEIYQLLTLEQRTEMEQRLQKRLEWGKPSRAKHRHF